MLSELDKLKYERDMARCTLKLCPKRGQSGYTSIGFEAGGRSVKLTAESRTNIQRKIDALTARIKQLQQQEDGT